MPQNERAQHSCGTPVRPWALRKAKVLAAGCHGGVHLLAQRLVIFVLGQVELCIPLLAYVPHYRKDEDSRLKQVCELGRRSLWP